ncbi:MAG TPA: hypothetical protein VF459_04420 [Caulobacteraceae bacterium]
MKVLLPKPLHGWRAFVGEVGIIVLGVLIALGAGQVAEMFHRDEQARLAEHAMRLELAEDDGPQAYARVTIGSCLENQIARIHDSAATAPADQLRGWVAVYAPPFRTWDNEAWKAVVSSNVGDYMGAERLVDWSAAYRVLPGLSDTNARETELATELHDALPPLGEPSPADRQYLRRVAGQLRVSNDRLTRGSQLFLARTRQLAATVPAPTQQTLLKTARSIYGACVRAPDVRAPAAAQSPAANLLGFVHN